MIPVLRCIEILQEAGWIYEGRTKVTGKRAYIFRQTKGIDKYMLTEQVHYLTTYGLRHAASKVSNNEAHLAGHRNLRRLHAHP